MEENKKYNVWNGVIIICNLSFLLILGAVWQLKELALSYVILGGFISIVMAIIEMILRQSKRKKIVTFINCLLLAFLFGGVLIFYAGKLASLPKLDSSLVLHFIITIPVILISLGIFALIILYSNLSEENERLQRDIEKKGGEEKSALEIAIRKYQEETNRKLNLLLQRNGIVDIKSLLKEKLSKYNGLIAIGNLLSLQTKQGTKLLEEFLGNKEDNLIDGTKKLYLVVPRETLHYLREIKKNLANDTLLNRIRVITLKPFILLQGLLIVGDFTTEEKSMHIKGYLKYKANLSEGESIVESGIYVDLSDISKERIPEELKESLKFIYELLLKQKYTHPDNYLIKQEFRKEETQKYNYELIMTKSSMCFYCDLDLGKCANCPIYKLEATEDKVKKYFEKQRKPYINGRYKTFD